MNLFPPTVPDQPVRSRRGQALATVALGAALSLLTTGAWAQIGNGPVGTNGRAGQLPNRPEKPREAPPEAIPGAKPKEAAAPATKPAGDMQPNDALFDAINRGDIASARDALNRGADLNAVNILGMTPMELSVDLGRNDISFLLLSMRGEDGGRGSQAVGRGVPPPPVAKTAQLEKRAKPAAALSSRTAESNRISPPKPVSRPKLFANDGGTPLPSAGFLGFDSKSASN